jgi:hypothetical protein
VPIIPTTTSAERPAIPVHKYESALPRPLRSHAALLRRSPSPSIALAAPGSGRAARPPPQIATVGGGRGACIPRCKEFSLVHFVETVGPAAGSPKVRQGPPTSALASQCVQLCTVRPRTTCPNVMSPTLPSAPSDLPRTGSLPGPLRASQRTATVCPCTSRSSTVMLNGDEAVVGGQHEGLQPGVDSQLVQ